MATNHRPCPAVRNRALLGTLRPFSLYIQVRHCMCRPGPFSSPPPNPTSRVATWTNHSETLLVLSLLIQLGRYRLRSQSLQVERREAEPTWRARTNTPATPKQHQPTLTSSTGTSRYLQVECQESRGTYGRASPYPTGQNHATAPSNQIYKKLYV